MKPKPAGLEPIYLWLSGMMGFNIILQDGGGVVFGNITQLVEDEEMRGGL